MMNMIAKSTLRLLLLLSTPACDLDWNPPMCDGGSCPPPEPPSTGSFILKFHKAYSTTDQGSTKLPTDNVVTFTGDTIPPGGHFEIEGKAFAIDTDEWTTSPVFAPNLSPASWTLHAKYSGVDSDDCNGFKSVAGVETHVTFTQKIDSKVTCSP